MRRTILLAAAALAGASALPASFAVAGGGGHGCSREMLGGAVTDARTTTIDMAKMCFSPTVARVDAGDTVVFVNRDPVPHAVGAAYDVFGDRFKTYGSGEKVSFRFEKEGTYPYFCALHPGMVGVVVVGDGKGASGTAGTVSMPEMPTERAGSTGGSDEGSALAPFLFAGLLGVGIAGGLAASSAARRRKEIPAVR